MSETNRAVDIDHGKTNLEIKISMRKDLIGRFAERFFSSEFYPTKLETTDAEHQIEKIRFLPCDRAWLRSLHT